MRSKVYIRDREKLLSFFSDEPVRVFRVGSLHIALLLMLVAGIVAWPTVYTTSATFPADAWVVEGDQAFANFGSSVAGVGDVNNDGYSDVVVAAVFLDHPEADEGRVFLYLGGAAGLAATDAWTAEGDLSYLSFGSSVAGAGDVNNDGYADVIIGAERFRNGHVNEGAAFVFLGDDTGLADTTVWRAESNQDEAYFGTSVASAGDVNDDGYDDVIVGAYLFDNDEEDEGRVYLYLGMSGGLSSEPAWTAEIDNAGAYFGATVAGAGDVNNDGYDDVIVGAPEYSNGETSEGGVFLYLGGSGGLSTTPDWTMEGNQPNVTFGSAVAGAGDVNNDGYADIIVGAELFDAEDTNEGRALVYLGSTTGPVTPPVWIGEGDQAFANFGTSVACAGDINLDGYADIVVGAYLHSNEQADEGRAYVFLGTDTGPADEPTWVAESDQPLAWFGRSVSGAGDVNGDDFSDVIVGAPHYENGETAEGRAYAFHGKVDIVAVALQLLDARWAGSQVEIVWRLLEWDTDPEFFVYRKVTGDPRFVQIVSPEISRRGSEYIFREKPIQNGISHDYRMTLVEDGQVVASFETTLAIPSLHFSLEQNYPNPFGSGTRLTFTIDRETHIELSIYDVAGRRVATPVDGMMPAGTHFQEWNGRDSGGKPMATGIYFYRLTAGNHALVRKAVLLR